MNSRTTIWLLVASATLAVIIWVAGQKARSARERNVHAAKAWEFAAENVSELTIQSGDLFVECVRRDGAWFLRQPLQSRADSGKVERILSVLESLPRLEVVTAAQRADRDLKLTDYGLRPPRARFVVVADGKRQELLLGSDAPLGRAVYVKTAQDDDVIATAPEVFVTIPSSVQSLRDRTILHGDAGRTTRIEIRCRGGGLVQLARAEGAWLIQQPFTDRADEGKVAAALDELYRLKAEDFVWDPPAAAAAPADGEAAARLDQYGLAPDTAAVRLQVWTSADPLGTELLLGNPVGGAGAAVFARLRDNPSIFTVPSNAVAHLSLQADELRDRNVFGVEPEAVRWFSLQDGDRKLSLARDDDGPWRVTEPAQWAADRETVHIVLALLTHLRIDQFAAAGATNLAAALASPRYRLRVAEHAPAPPAADAAAETARAASRLAPLRDVLLVAEPAPGATNVVAGFEGGLSVFTMAAAPIAALGEYAADPLLYRDRTMLALPPDSIVRLSRLADGREQTVVRAEAGAWAPAAPATNAAAQDVARDAVQDVLFLCANLRALRAEAHHLKNLAAYGLDQPAVTLTLGLRGDAGIQKRIMLGFKAKTDGVFAMVQDEDVVFVLAKALAERLSRSLLTPPAPEPDAGKPPSG